MSPIMQLDALFSLVGSSPSPISRASALNHHFCSFLFAPICQLPVEAGPEEPWVAVGLHQAENLILDQLEGGGTDAKKQALTG